LALFQRIWHQRELAPVYARNEGTRVIVEYAFAIEFIAAGWAHPIPRPGPADAAPPGGLGPDVTYGLWSKRGFALGDANPHYEGRGLPCAIASLA
jgi:hypothetical protein